MRTKTAHRWVMAALALTLPAYPLIPVGGVRDVWYSAVGLLCMAAAGVGLLRRPPGTRRGWTLVFTGFLGMVIGDLVFSVEQDVVHLAVYPAPSDAIYIASYGFLAAGLLPLVRRRGGRADLAPLLDAAILAGGTAVVAGVFVIAPIAQDSTLTVWGKLVSSLYPVADVLLLGILVQLWTTPGTRSPASRLLFGALGLTLLADVIWNITTVTSGDVGSSAWNDLLWLGGYLFAAGAAWAPSAEDLSEPTRGRVDVTDPRRRLFALTGGLLLPAVTLLVDGLVTSHVAWPVVGVGSVVLSGLVLARMAGLLNVIRTQAVQLAALARSDALTGAPNRRTWDHELSSACRTAREDGTPLAVAIVDLDHFKTYNDSHGHPAGDLLLREATAIWTHLLDDGEMLARYGGEEFALLLPGLTPLEAQARVRTLLDHTPHGQTFSAGVAMWDHATEPATALAAADAALYDAKRAGRNRICVATAGRPAGKVPVPSIVVQPIVDLETREPVAVEALSRFEHADPHTVFTEAHRAGTGPELEAAAIRAALEHRPRGGLLSVNVSIDALTSPQVQEALPEDLTGVMLEITEHTDTEPCRELAATVDRIRSRGGVIAVDDWGQGYSNLDRLLRLRPEIVKLDISLVRSLDSTYHRAAIRSVTSWADSVGAKVCAEGIETEAQWRDLQTLGVHMGQGYFFGRPAAPVPVAAPVERLAG